MEDFSVYFREIGDASKQCAARSAGVEFVALAAVYVAQKTAPTWPHTGADDALAFKENHPKLPARARRLVEATPSRDAAAVRSSCGHDRVERRRAVVVAPGDLDFLVVAAIRQVESERSVAGDAEPPVLRWFLLSRPITAAKMLEIARAHWTIENQLHWVLDSSMAEDAARRRKDNSPYNLALIRKLALHMLRKHPERVSSKAKSSAQNGTTTPSSSICDSPAVPGAPPLILSLSKEGKLRGVRLAKARTSSAVGSVEIQFVSIGGSSAHHRHLRWSMSYRA
jgi:predicted transposase YbfD/YdcC